MNKNKDNFLKSKRSYSFVILMLVLLVVMLCGGCMSQHERNGVSLLPQNRPSGRGGLGIPNSGMGLTF